MNSMEKFSARYLETLHQTLDSKSRLDEIREAVVINSPSTGARRSATLTKRILPAVAIAAAAVLAISLLIPESRRFTVGASTAPGQEGQWLNAEESPLPIAFNDGTQILLHAGASGRVDLLHPEEVRLSLNHGIADFNVIHSDQVAWRIDAGPYRVHVVGTKFSAQWLPDSQTFRLSLREGIVEVNGPGLSRQRVLAGQTLSASVKPQSAALYRTTEVATDSAHSEQVGAPRESGHNNSAVETKQNNSGRDKHSKSQDNDRMDWRDSARQARYTEALTLARKAGWNNLVNTLPHKDLYLLAETARLANAPNDAITAYEMLRKRFPNTESGHDAAFMLGRVVQNGGRPTEALRLFDTYLREKPSGRWAMEASGRRLEVLTQSGNRAAAKQAAIEYLKRYPNGNHAPMASKLASGDVAP
jgi:transmembrane sensor